MSIIRLNQFEYDPEKDFLASGAFAEVFKAKDINSPSRFVALKIYKEAISRGSEPNSTLTKYDLEREFENTLGLSHENVISYLGLEYFDAVDHLGRKSRYPVLVMEYASEGDLTHFIKKVNPSMAIREKLALQIIDGVDYLHRQGIIHRDLKPGNILITKDKRGEYVAKITDFGISKDTVIGKTVEQSYTEGVGTPHYMAPEQFYVKQFGANGKIDHRCDLWAVGIIMHWLFTGRLPFANGSKDYEEIRNAITNSNYNDQHFSATPAQKAAVRACLQKKTTQRVPSAKGIANILKGHGGVKIPVKAQAKPQTINYGNGFLNKMMQKKWFAVGNTVLAVLWVIVFSFITLISFGASFLGENNNEIYSGLFGLTFGISGILTFIPIAFDKEIKLANIIGLSVILTFAIALFFIPFSELVSEGATSVFLGLVFVTFILLTIIPVVRYWNFNTSSSNLNWMLGVIFVVYLIAFPINSYSGYSGAYLVLSELPSRNINFTLFPNFYFLTVLILYQRNWIKRYPRFIFFWGVVATFLAMAWWIFIDGDGHVMLLEHTRDRGEYITELKVGYYLWQIAIVALFAYTCWYFSIGGKYEAAIIISIIISVFLLMLMFFGNYVTSVSKEIEKDNANLNKKLNQPTLVYENHKMPELWSGSTI